MLAAEGRFTRWYLRQLKIFLTKTRRRLPGSENFHGMHVRKNFENSGSKQETLKLSVEYHSISSRTTLGSPFKIQLGFSSPQMLIKDNSSSDI